MADVTGDGVADFVLVGSFQEETFLGIVEGPLRENSRQWKLGARGTKGILLTSPDCDALHVYFDGRGFASWSH
jgi:hypothetical protein